jgi:hypothetical protein
VLRRVASGPVLTSAVLLPRSANRIEVDFGLRITLTAGTAKGEGLMRRLDVSADPIVMLDAALQEAARAAGVQLTIEEGSIYLTRAE